ncbi:phosphoribosylglycinamide formyltransferase [Niabella insulamsoli]|uniref:phosphoribosylglycinamide formyltransferase n=1 Tax=Niabella insulamsoli TaxID=3144874 RepID=UPI0031FC267B
MKQKLAIFASGAGSNAKKIIEHFKNSPVAAVALVVCNKPHAGVLDIAAAAEIETALIERDQYKKDGYAQFLKEKGIDFVILAGFLWKIPQPLIDAFPRGIINIHPALLPKYGGKGMYGAFVHEAVIAAKDAVSGITIHYVDEHYDHGDVIFQATCDIAPGDTPDQLAEKVHQLEHEHFPRVIEQLLTGK